MPPFLHVCQPDVQYYYVSRTYCTCVSMLRLACGTCLSLPLLTHTREKTRNVSKRRRSAHHGPSRPGADAAHDGRERTPERRAKRDVQRRDDGAQRQCAPDGGSRMRLCSPGSAQHRSGLVHEGPGKRVWGCGLHHIAAQVRQPLSEQQETGKQ